jgi:hypothetical protein
MDCTPGSMSPAGWFEISALVGLVNVGLSRDPRENVLSSVRSSTSMRECRHGAKTAFQFS